MNFKMEYFGIYSLLRIRNQNSLAKRSEENGKGQSVNIKYFKYTEWKIRKGPLLLLLLL